MGKPSIFNKDYHRIMRRRKLIYRTLILFAAIAVIFVTYNKSAIPNLKKIVDNIKSSSKININESQKEKEQKPQTESKNNTDSNVEQLKQEEQAKPEPPPVSYGEFSFKFPNNDIISIVYAKNDNDSKFTGIKPENTGISFDIRDDGKAIVFDNPKISDIWIFNIDGSSLKLNPGNYKEYEKAGIMEQYENKYIWAEKPKFLKDGRIVYQSNLPWFKDENTYYMWAVNSDGTENRMFLGIGQSQPVKYSGFTDDGKLIIEYGGNKYTFNIEDRSRQKIE